MRIVFIGASSLAIMTAHLLVERRHEVVIIERDKAKIDTLKEELDCGFLHGDGSKPALLAEADPAHTDALLCLTGNDQANIIASLVGRSLGFPRVITKIGDPEFQHICIELGLEDTIIPNRTTALHLVDSLRGMNTLELSGLLKDDARVFSLVARDEDAGPVEALQIPDSTRVICVYRDDRFIPVDDGVELRAGDEVVLITRDRHMTRLTERWGSHDTTSPPRRD